MDFGSATKSQWIEIAYIISSGKHENIVSCGKRDFHGNKHESGKIKELNQNLS